MTTANAKSGFTLVEVALALLVAGLGLMAVFALFPQGADASRKSVDATEVSAFADGVFNMLQNEASAYSWASFADNMTLNKSHLTTQMNVKAVDDTPQLYTWVPFYFGQGAASGNDLYISNYAVAAFTYLLEVASVPGTDLKSARLEVWPGYRVNVASNGAPGGTVFYREFLPPE